MTIIVVSPARRSVDWSIHNIESHLVKNINNHGFSNKILTCLTSTAQTVKLFFLFFIWNIDVSDAHISKCQFFKIIQINLSLKDNWSLYFELNSFIPLKICFKLNPNKVEMYLFLIISRYFFLDIFTLKENRLSILFGYKFNVFNLKPRLLENNTKLKLAIIIYIIRQLYIGFLNHLLFVIWQKIIKI